MPCDTGAHSGGKFTHKSAQEVAIDGADGVSPGAPNATADGGDSVDDVKAMINPLTTLAIARDRETLLYRIKHKQRGIMMLRFNKSLWKVILVYLMDSLPGTAVCDSCEARGDFASAEYILVSPTICGSIHTRERKGIARR